MVSEWYEGVTLSSEWVAAGDAPAFYRLTLSNRGEGTLSGFQLGASGPAFVIGDAPIVGGRVVTQLSNYCEFAPPAGFTLRPGADWTVDILKPELPIRHWTDGAVTGFLVLADGSTRSLRTLPAQLAGEAAHRKRGTARYPVPELPPAPVSVIPWPRSVAVSGRRTAPHGLTLTATGDAAAAAVESFAQLTRRLFPGEGLVREAHAGGYPVELAPGPGGEEGYALDFATDRVRLTAETPTGFLYGLVTLGQMLRGARSNLHQLSFPTAGRIEDAPRYRWRGCHLDVARRFYSTDDVAQFIALLAWNKLNVLHWHLSDDEAWRVEIDAYPALTQQAAWRGHGLSIPPLLGSGPEPSGGYYSKAEVRELVALAAGFGIEVVPEIDVPGHCYALVQAVPALRDAGENGLYHSIQSFPNNCLNPGVEATYGVIETIFGELVELFPSRWFHVGADEVPHDAWETSPAARALAARLGTEGTAPLQAHFLQRVQAFLTSQGRITGAWEEAAQGGGIDRASAYLVGWKDTAISQKLAAEGYDVVVAPAQAYYFDMANGPEFDECGAAWAGFSSLENTYRFEPAAGWSAAERAHLLGIQGCIWCEPMTDRAVFDRLVFPRLSAIAETGWSTDRDFARFTALVGLMPNLYGNYEDS
ncbi:MAG: beta-N-acetylhexosaminidase [Devosia sp.]